MKWAFGLLMFVGVIGCGSFYQDPEFKPYLDQIIQYCDNYNCEKQQEINNTSIFFVTTEELNDEDNTSTDVHVANGQPGEIKISRTYWDNVNDNARIFLLVHELGHSVWSKEHNFEKDVNSCPISIMFPNATFLADCLQFYNQNLDNTYMNNLLDEFFNN